MSSSAQTTGRSPTQEATALSFHPARRLPGRGSGFRTVSSGVAGVHVRYSAPPQKREPQGRCRASRPSLSCRIQGMALGPASFGAPAEGALSTRDRTPVLRDPGPTVGTCPVCVNVPAATSFSTTATGPTLAFIRAVAERWRRAFAGAFRSPMSAPLPRLKLNAFGPAWHGISAGVRRAALRRRPPNKRTQEGDGSRSAQLPYSKRPRASVRRCP
jgi:hypothetical protein